MYQSNIPALPNVAKAIGADVVAGSVAAAVVANTALNFEDVEAAALETRARRRVRDTNGQSVTSGEVGQALVRQHIVTAEHAAQVNPAAVAPVWFGPAMAAWAGPAIDAAVGPAVAAAMGSMLAAIRNQDLKRQNEQVINLRIPENVSLHPLLKEVDGVGAGLPEHPIGAAAIAAALPDVVVLAVGNPIPSPPFPEDSEALNALSHQRLSLISAMYNDTFGILAGDTLPTWRWKFTLFVS